VVVGRALAFAALLVGAWLLTSEALAQPMALETVVHGAAAERPAPPAPAVAPAPAPESETAEEAEAGGEERVQLAEPVENMIRLLVRGVDIVPEEDTPRGNRRFCMQLRPKGSGAMLRAVVRF
jgi:hypothetical protein